MAYFPNIYQKFDYNYQKNNLYINKKMIIIQIVVNNNNNINKNKHFFSKLLCL